MTGAASAGPLRCYRVADGRFALLDGLGAARVGGRWNSPGRPAVYASLTYANALLEVLVHHGRSRVPPAHVWLTLDLAAGAAVARVDPARLLGWDAASLAASRAAGDAWLRAGREVALVVPAKPAAPHEWNVLLNPAHPGFGEIAVGGPERVAWDGRLWG